MASHNPTKDRVVSHEDVATTNACKLCSPLGASLVFKGIAGCVPLIHGSQGCATYIRRYLISHFREPMDIASTNFVESTTIFGGQSHFATGLDNIISQYEPKMIGVATTCLSETIGDDVNMFLNEYRKSRTDKELPEFVAVSTPSYRGTHMDGFHAATHQVVKTLAKPGPKGDHVNIFPGFVSAADLRHLHEMLDDFGLKRVMVPDYSESLDNPTWDEYQRIPEGGTPVEAIATVGCAKASIELGDIFGKENGASETAGEYLNTNYGVPRYACGFPIGINATDSFMAILSELSGKPVPEKYQKERGRLIDSYVDGHKYLFGKKAFVYGEEDFVVGMALFLAEIGIIPVLCASGGESGLLKAKILSGLGDATHFPPEDIEICNGMDFDEIMSAAESMQPDLLVGGSRGYHIARKLDIPLVRCGFPVHDRVGAQRIKHLGYEGTQALFDLVTNALIEYKQENSPVGYKYI